MALFYELYLIKPVANTVSEMPLSALIVTEETKFGTLMNHLFMIWKKEQVKNQKILEVT